MDHIMVTVFCTAFNHVKYIRKALEGFVSQETDFAYEVLVHDDASTDGTADIIKEYEKKYPNIIKGIYQKENIYSRGINRTYTYMLPMTHGKYIALCEGDDYWIDSHKLQSQVEYLQRHPDCSLVAHEAISLYPSGEEKKYVDYNFGINNNITIEQIIDHHTLFPTASMMFSAEFYRKNKNFLIEHPAYDYLLKIMLAAEGRVHVIPQVMSVYRIATEGSWTNRVAKNKEKYIKHEEMVINSFFALDKYLNYKYHLQFEHEILKRKYHIKELSGQYKNLRKEPYKSIYQEKSFKERMAVRIKSNYHFYQWAKQLRDKLLK